MCFLNNINCLILDLPVSIYAFTKSNSDGTYTIILNARNSFEKQYKSYLHEVRHIKNNDFSKQNVQAIESISHDFIQPYKFEIGKELSF